MDKEKREIDRRLFKELSENHPKASKLIKGIAGILLIGGVCAIGNKNSEKDEETDSNEKEKDLKLLEYKINDEVDRTLRIGISIIGVFLGLGEIIFNSKQFFDLKNRKYLTDSSKINIEGS